MTDDRKDLRSRRRAAKIAALVVLLMLASVMFAPYSGGALPDRLEDSPYVIPSEFRGHRPILEFFTGLSCPACMAGPHPETEDMYSNIRDDESVPWTYVVFHELNGGGVDGLATDESRQRMRYYQPGVSGTPAIEVDGGWHTLGGIYGVDDISPSNNQVALDSAADRYNRHFDPRHPRDILRNDFKFVNLEVAQNLEGTDWVVTVKIDYLGMDRLLLEEDLHGSLYVFMVEDDVTAFSTYEDADVLNHNVFRGYAIEGLEFTMAPGEDKIFAGFWPIPTIEVNPNEDYPDGTPVPVKSMDITAVAAIYDLDDTNSGDGIYGNPNPVPRCIQSATPQSTAYDLANSAEPVGEVTVTSEGHTLSFDAKIDDPDGVSSAAVHFSIEGANNTTWIPLELKVSGEEVCDDEGVCYAYTDASAVGSIEISSPVEEVWFVITYSDGLGAMGKSDMLYTEVNAAVVAGEGSSLAGGTLIVILIVVVLAALGILFYRTPEKQARTALAAVMVIVLLTGSVFAMSAGGNEGATAPEITFTDIDQNTMSLSDFEGKVVVLDMMATWCPGCRKAMSELKKVHDKYGDSIEMITVDIDPKETPAQLRDFKKEYDAGWRFTMDTPDQKFLKEFKVQEIPKIIVIDINGGVVFAEAAEVPADELMDIIDEAAMGGRSLVSLGAGGTSAGGLVIWAMALGVLAFFAPCSFPLLPGYMTYYLGIKDKNKKPRKALHAGLAAAAGIVLLFLTVAILVGIFGSTISKYILYLQPIVGVLLIILALMIFLNINLNYGRFTYPLRRAMGFAMTSAGRLKRKVRGEATDEGVVATDDDVKAVEGPFYYGLGYGAAAAGCMAPVVIALIILAASLGTFLGAFGIFLVFALSMASLMVIITLAVGTYGETLMKKVNVSPEKQKMFSAVLLLGVGGWILVYFASGVA
jgi:cytochrome c-type biogenesis protein